MTLDIKKNREQMNYSRKEYVARMLWAMVNRLLFRLTPRILWDWRCFLLRVFGAKVGKHVHISNTSRIWMPWNLSIGDWSSIGEEAWIYNLGKVTIGSKVTISYRAHLCAGTHDYQDPTMPLKKLPIFIDNEAWICTDAFVGPGVVVGEGAIAGARAVVVRDISPWDISVGNPARPIKKRKSV